MRSLWCLVIFLSVFCTHAQDTAHTPEKTYLKFELSTPLRVNPDRGSENPYTGEKNYWFLPDGINARVGAGFHYHKLLSIGITAGVDWKTIHALVAVPVYAEIGINPKVGDEMRFYFNAGYGKSFALGRGNLSGDYKKISLGIGDDDGLSIFVELGQYGFPLHGSNSIGSVSIGISSILF